MNVTLANINSRLFKKARQIDEQKLVNYSRIICYDESSGTFNENNTITKIRNWEGLGSEQVVSYAEALDCLNLLIEHCPYGAVVNRECDFLVSEMNKVRDILQVKNSIKYQQAKLKNKLASPEKNIRKALNRSQSINQPKQNFKPEDKAQECYSKLSAALDKILESDRIVKNYTGVNKIFGIDRLVSEFGNDKRDFYDVAYTIAACCSSFDTPLRNMYNTALETTWYGMGKRHFHCSRRDIIEAVTDFFIFNGGLRGSDIQDIAFIRKITPVFTHEDFDCISYLFPDEVQYPIIAEARTFDDLIQANQPSLPEKEDAQKEITKLIQSFKKSCAKNPESSANNPLLKALITDLTTKYPDQVYKYFPQLMTQIRMNFIIYNSTIPEKDLNELINRLVKAFVATSPSIEQMKRFISVFKKEIDVLKQRLEKLGETDDESKDLIEAYTTILIKTVAGLDEYMVANYSQTQENLFPGSTSPEDQDVQECATVELISRLMSGLLEGVQDQDVTRVIIGNISKFKSGVLDGLVDLANTSPEIVDKKSLKEAITDLRNSLRGMEAIASYIRVDELNKNLYNLESANVYRSGPNPKYLIGCLMCLEEFKRLALSDQILNENSAIEAIDWLNRQKENGSLIRDEQNSSMIDNAIESIAKSMKEDLTKEKASVEKTCLLGLIKAVYIATDSPSYGWVQQSFNTVLDLVVKFFTHQWRTDDQRQAALEQIEHCIGVCDSKIDQGQFTDHDRYIINSIKSRLERAYQQINFVYHYMEG